MMGQRNGIEASKSTSAHKVGHYYISRTH